MFKINQKAISNRINEQLKDNQDSEQVLKLQKAMKVTPITCMVLTLTGLLLNSPLILLIAASSTLVGAFSNNSLYDRIYNIWAKDKVPPLGAARSIGCGFGAVVLSFSAYSMYNGDALMAYLSAGFMIVLAGLAAVTQICFVSKVLLLLGIKRANSCCEPDK